MPGTFTETNVSLLCGHGQTELRERVLSELGVSEVTSIQQCKTRFLLCFDELGLLGLIDCQFPKVRPVIPQLFGRRKNNGADPMMRAIGYKARQVIDCTAGWGSDASHICGHGIDVCAIEQNHILWLMLDIALEKSAHNIVRERLTVKKGDSYTVLQSLTAPVDVIYIDPMYPPKPGNAAPKKELILLQNLLPVAANEAQLVQLARSRIRNRVVVKRPHYAPAICAGVSGSTRGKLVRYDIYPPL